MELGFLPRSLWATDNKLLQHHVTDLFTSVHVTRDLSAGASFGPCVLHNTFYDTIAFIALKSCEKRSKSYVFRVDAEAVKSSPLVLSWLRLVQAASNKEEQNMEAYLRSGQLYFRSTRNIQKDEELLVWYDEELSHLLGFSEIKTRTLTDGFRCTKCDQAFSNEYPFLAHCRFLCAQVKNDARCHELHEHKTMEIKRQRRVTDFHNIARELEHKKTNEEANMSPRKRRHDELDGTKVKKPVLLEKTNIITHTVREGQTVPELAASVMKHNADKFLFKNDLPECKQSAFTEVRRIKERLKQERSPETDDGPGVEQTGQGRVRAGSSLQSDGSAFSFVLPKGTHGEQKSAFCKPSKKTTSDPAVHPAQALSSRPERSKDIADAIASKTVLGYGSLLGSSLLNGELSSRRHAPAPAATVSSFPFASDHWHRPIGVPVQAASSLPLLPPTFTSFGVSVQNWCAKCNLSFRMTSDLVFHMRSHHKKEFAAESQVRRRREEKLTCPICHEYFRERHHLSRHMTSHN
ncbi:PR domain zinc finger protein 8 [Conger conger]|uniref:PR domain zinc finger protein 8 n=1 Tax=Conger conger TaxID=82655 RepID=UPI002A59BDA9|nr:PR domain zinc finger protein 8 [Conger conger]XP_061084735.1 PR domain zinc finger protein 8 [Conger conger]XP_061084736.1 PR domain zinc finger protein 8 [Conger conger]